MFMDQGTASFAQHVCPGNSKITHTLVQVLCCKWFIDLYEKSVFKTGKKKKILHLHDIGK